MEVEEESEDKPKKKSAKDTKQKAK